MDFFGGLSEISETSEMKGMEGNEISKESNEKFDKLMGDDKLRETLPEQQNNRPELNPVERENKFNKLFDIGDFFKKETVQPDIGSTSVEGMIDTKTDTNEQSSELEGEMSQEPDYSEKREPNSSYEFNGNTYETDDNGQTYKKNGEILPNTEYTVNGNTYKTDENGNKISCDSNPEYTEDGSRNMKEQKESGGEERQYDNDAPNSNNDATNEVNTTEYNEDGTRELTEDEKQAIKDKLGWSDEKIKKCTIDKDGVIHYKTNRCDLEGKTSENGVPYERRRIVINGVVIEGVFPKFDSLFDTELAPDNLKTKAYAKECNAALKEAIANDPELRSKFTPEQLKDIEEGRTPTGYVWHHNEEPGKMQLVKREDHDRATGGAAHTGGNSLWGADSVDNGKKGESF